LETRLALSDLAARYCHLIDARDYAGAAALFEEDGSLCVPDQRITGRREVQAFLADQLERYEFTYHYVHSQVVDVIEGERAHAIVDAHAEHAKDGSCVLAGIRYADVYHRHSSGWKFQERDLQIRYFLPWLELGARYRRSRRFPAGLPLRL
jgi:hypothetical protein